MTSSDRPSQNRTLYAHWIPNVTGVTVTFHANGGALIGNRSKQVFKGQPYGELPTATLDGYHFDGWFTASYGGTEVTPDTIVNQTASYTLHAHWTPNDRVNPPPGSFKCGDSVTGTLENGVLTLSGTGAMYDYTNGTEPPWASAQENIRSIRIESGITSIGASAFERCSNLVSIEFPNQLNSIGMSAFERCNGLTSIIISGNVNSIGMSAFEECNSLTSVTISGNVNSIGMSAFESCSNWSSVTISGSVNSIGMSAFEDCSNLSNLTISTRVNSIGMSAFEDCSKLTDVYFSGTSAQWQRISIGMDAFPDSITIQYGNE